MSKLGLAILVILAAIGCSRERAGADRFPTTPGPPPPPQLTFIFAMVFPEGSAVCIPGATIEVVGGQHAGEKVTQITPCDYWGYDGGASFSGLTPGVAMTLRASAAGYASLDKVVMPSHGPQTTIAFVLSRSP